MGAVEAWSWREGSVNRGGDYLSLAHDESGDELLALVSPPADRVFVVEMLRPDGIDATTRERLLTDVRRELDFYLLEVGGDDPWKYGIYHCGTMSNVYSNVHWGCHEAGHGSPR